MSAFRLQTFVPEAEAGGPRLARGEVDAVREAAYRDGFLAGQSAATEAYLDDQARLSSELVETVSDARLTNEAARRHVAASVAPLVAAIVEAMTPALAEAGLAAEVVARVEQALKAAPQSRPTLRVAPELVAGIRSIFAERRLAASVEAAPEFLPREAALHWDEGFDRIDLGACAAAIRASVAAHLDLAEPEEERHGVRRCG